MDSRNTLLAITVGAALATVIGILLTFNADASEQNTTKEKASDEADSAGEAEADSVANVTYRLQKMSDDINRMINEGGNAV